MRNVVRTGKRYEEQMGRRFWGCVSLTCWYNEDQVGDGVESTEAMGTRLDHRPVKGEPRAANTVVGRGGEVQVRFRNGVAKQRSSEVNLTIHPNIHIYFLHNFRPQLPSSCEARMF